MSDLGFNAPGGPMAQQLGIVITEASAQRVVGTMPVEGNTQPYGLLNGGASLALAETLGSIGAHLHAHQPGQDAGGLPGGGQRRPRRPALHGAPHLHAPRAGGGAGAASGAAGAQRGQSSPVRAR